MPEWEWMRVIGRASAPIWFYVAGYSSSLDKPLPKNWLYWGLGVDAVLFATLPNDRFVPLCVLFTLFAARFAVPIIYPLKAKAPAVFYAVLLACAAFAIPSDKLAEYGTLGVLWGLAGYMAKQNEPACVQTSFLMVLAVVQSLAMWVMFSFTFSQTLQVLAYVGLAVCALWQFSPARFKPVQAGWLPYAVLHFFGRYSLPFYAVHLTVFAVLYKVFI